MSKRRKMKQYIMRRAIAPAGSPGPIMPAAVPVSPPTAAWRTPTAVCPICLMEYEYLIYPGVTCHKTDCIYQYWQNKFNALGIIIAKGEN